MDASPRRIRGFALVALAALALMACGDPNRQTSGTTLGANDVPAALSANAVSVGVAGDDSLPIVELGSARGKGQVWVYAAKDGKFSQLPSLPETVSNNYLGASQVAATASYVVLVSSLCAEPPTELDSGYDCASPTGTLIGVFDRSSAMWATSTIDSNGVPTIAQLSDKAVRLRGSKSDGTSVEWEVLVPAAAVNEVARTKGFTGSLCAFAADPPTQFVVSEDNTEVNLVQAEAAKGETVRIRGGLNPSGVGTSLACYSAGPWLGVPGDPPPIGTDTPANVPSATRPDAPTTTVGATRGTDRLTVYNLLDASAQGIQVGDGSAVNAFVGTDRYLAVLSSARVDILKVGSNEPLKTYAFSADRVVALPGGVVAFTFNGGSGLKSIRTIEL